MNAEQKNRLNDAVHFGVCGIVAEINRSSLSFEEQQALYWSVKRAVSGAFAALDDVYGKGRGAAVPDIPAQME